MAESKTMRVWCLVFFPSPSNQQHSFRESKITRVFSGGKAEYVNWPITSYNTKILNHDAVYYANACTASIGTFRSG